MRIENLSGREIQFNQNQYLCLCIEEKNLELNNNCSNVNFSTLQAIKAAIFKVISIRFLTLPLYFDDFLIISMTRYRPIFGYLFAFNLKLAKLYNFN